MAIVNKDCIPCRKSFADNYFLFRKRLQHLRIPLPQKGKEFQELCTEVGIKKPRVIVEIGTRDGGSLWMLSQYAPAGSTIISIDLENALWGRPGTYRNRDRALAALSNKGYITHKINADSQLDSTRAELEAILAGRPINFLFIDGDHTYGGVKRDWDLYKDLVEPGGLIAFHDISDCPSKAPKVKVPQLWSEIKGNYKHKEFIQDPGDVMGIGVLWK